MKYIQTFEQYTFMKKLDEEVTIEMNESYSEINEDLGVTVMGIAVIMTLVGALRHLKKKIKIKRLIKAETDPEKRATLKDTLKELSLSQVQEIEKAKKQAETNKAKEDLKIGKMEPEEKSEYVEKKAEEVESTKEKLEGEKEKLEAEEEKLDEEIKDSPTEAPEEEK